MIDKHYVWASVVLLLGAFFGGIHFDFQPGWAVSLAIGLHIWWTVFVAGMSGVSRPSRYEIDKEHKNEQKS